MNKTSCDNPPKLKFFYCKAWSINLKIKLKAHLQYAISINLWEKPRKKVYPTTTIEDCSIEKRDGLPPLFDHFCTGGTVRFLSRWEEHYEFIIIIIINN